MLMTKQYTFQRSPLKGFKLHVLNLFQPQKQRQFYSRNQKPMGVTAASQLQKLEFPIQLEIQKKCLKKTRVVD
jgi:hypothetical protein